MFHVERRVRRTALNACFGSSRDLGSPGRAEPRGGRSCGARRSYRPQPMLLAHQPFSICFRPLRRGRGEASALRSLTPHDGPHGAAGGGASPAMFHVEHSLDLALVVRGRATGAITHG